MPNKKKGCSLASLLMPTKIGICHRMINIFFSAICGGGMLVGAAICLDEAPSADSKTIAKNQQLKAITATGLIITCVQVFICVPYAIVSHKKGGKLMHYFFALYHIFVAIVSTILFFLAFYLVETTSQELRKNFWAQFKFKVDKITAYMGAYMTFADFCALNAIFSVIIVIYPGLSKAWNRDNDNNVQIPLQ